MPAPTPTRRQFGVSFASAALAATAGVFYGSRDARAVDVDVQDLTIEQQHVASPETPTAINLVIDGEWAVDSNVIPDELVVIPSAQVADSVMGMHEFESVRIESIESRQASGEFTATLDLRALQALRDVFPETEGESITKQIKVELLVGARKNGEQIGSAQAVQTFALELQHAPNSADVGFDAVGTVELQ